MWKLKLLWTWYFGFAHVIVTQQFAMIAIGAKSKEVRLNARLAQNGFGTSCKRGTRVTLTNQLMPNVWYIREKTRALHVADNVSRKYVHVSPGKLFCVYTSLTLSCIFKVHWSECNVSYICNRLTCNDAWKKITASAVHLW